MKTPLHIAIIMDGNGRWAKKRKLPRIFGHREGAKSVREITEACAETGVKYLTLYAFSTENWKRPKKEVKFLMGLLNEYLDGERQTLIKNNIKFEVIGEIKGLSAVLRKKIAETRKITAKNKRMTMILALNYGSRDEIVKAVRKIAGESRKRKINPAGITGKTIEKNLYTKDFPDPDLLIRTSGEMRISNFLLWQIAYSEIYVTKTLWPDFRKKELKAAIREFQKRERRYGGI